MEIFSDYMTFLNSFDKEVKWQILLQNHFISREDVLKKIRMAPQQDGLNVYRQEMNAIQIKMTATGKSSIEQSKYLVVSIEDVSYENAKNRLEKIESNVDKYQMCIRDRFDENAADSDDNYINPFDEIFEKIRSFDPTSQAVTQYDIFQSAGTGKTRDSILITTTSQLSLFGSSNIAHLTATDEMDLDSFADKKSALFICIPTEDNTFNFLASLLYSCLLYTSVYTMYLLLCSAMPSVWKQKYRVLQENDG